MTTATATSPLKARFGHEENLSRHLAQHHMGWLLGQMELSASGVPALEQRVSKGKRGHAGRLDVLQPTTEGSVIVEVQYGPSDSAHRTRFKGYLSSTDAPLCIVWVAESFRPKDLWVVRRSGLPVVCVKAQWKRNLRLETVEGIETLRFTRQERAAKGHVSFAEKLAQADHAFFNALATAFRTEGNDIKLCAWANKIVDGEIVEPTTEEKRAKDRAAIQTLLDMTPSAIAAGANLPPFSYERKWSFLALKIAKSIPVDYRKSIVSGSLFWGKVLQSAQAAIEAGYAAA